MKVKISRSITKCFWTVYLQDEQETQCEWIAKKVFFSLLFAKYFARKLSSYKSIQDYRNNRLRDRFVAFVERLFKHKNFYYENGKQVKQ